MPLPRLIVALATALLCACGLTGKDLASSPTTATNSATQTQIVRGLTFVAAQCSGCHAVQPGIEPPNPQAPSFVAVANEMGFTQDTLREFFRDGHDTPTAMTIQLEEDEAEIAAAYIMSLRTSR